MTNVCVITGDGSGIGLETAKCMPKDKILVISGRTQAKLDGAVDELEALGFEAYGVPCDVSVRRDVHELAAISSLKGTITNVINVASNSAYALPDMPLIKGTYELADEDEDKFVKRIMRAAVGRNDYEKSGMIYSLSKNFVVWYAQKCAFEYGPAGIRVCSVSPGLIETGMGTAEKEASAEIGFTAKMIDQAAERRMGEPEELGFAIATIADERNGYLTGVDVLVDGGSTNGANFR